LTIFSAPRLSLSTSTLIELANWSPQSPSHIAPGIEMKRRQSRAWARISICGMASASNRARARLWTSDRRLSLRSALFRLFNVLERCGHACPVDAGGLWLIRAFERVQGF
jgi:hypothetical protein